METHFSETQGISKNNVLDDRNKGPPFGRVEPLHRNDGPAHDGPDVRLLPYGTAEALATSTKSLDLAWRSKKKKIWPTKDDTVNGGNLYYEGGIYRLRISLPQPPENSCIFVYSLEQLTRPNPVNFVL